MKKVILFILLLCSSAMMAQVKTDVQLKAQADTIRYETNPKSNNATRIGNMLNALVSSKSNKGLLDTSKTLSADSDTLIPSQKAVKAYVLANGSTKLNKGLLDTSKTLSADSDTLIPSQKAVKAYVLANGSTKGYKEFRARLSQSGTSVPQIENTFIDEITRGIGTSDSLFRSVTLSRNGVGDYSILVNYKIAFPIFFDQLDLSFNDAKARLIGSWNGSNGTYNFQVFNFKTYLENGSASDGVLAFSNIYIRLYE